MHKPDRGGRSLREILDESAPLPIAQTVAIGAQLAYELAHAHDRGIVHRGVRPANIVVHRDPRTPEGIGTARLCGTRVSSDAQADAFDYQSPEQVRGEAEVDGRADLFALGAVLYEMLTGKLPDNASEPHALEPRLPSELNPHVPPEVDGLVLAMLAKEREDRLPDAMVAGHALHRIDQQLRGEIAAREPAPVAVEPARVAVNRLLRLSTSITVTSALASFIGAVVYFGSNAVPPITTVAAEPTLALAPGQPTPMDTPVAEELPAQAPAPTPPAEAPPTQARRVPTQRAERPLVATSARASPARAKPAAGRSKSRASPPPVPKRETAKVIISVSPWAEIYVNGTRRGISPPVSVIELSPGKHRIDIRHTSQPPYLAYVNVKAGETRKLRHDFLL